MPRAFSPFSIATVITAILTAGAGAAESRQAVAGLAERAMPDPRVRTYVRPLRVVWHSEDGVENAEALLKPGANQITLVPKRTCVLRTRETPTGVLLDFGKELSDGVRIGVKNLAIGKHVGDDVPNRGKAAHLRIRFGESVSEAMSDVGDEANATNDHAVRDLTCLVPWLGSQEVGNTGFRFIRIDLLDKNGISSYSMWWVLLQHEWRLYTGYREYLAEQESYLTGLLELLAEKYIGPDNREMLPDMRFLDWPSSGNEKAIHAGLQSLLTMTFDAGAELCHVLGNEPTRRTCLEAAARLRKHRPDPGGSKQAAALMALAKLASAESMNREVLAKDGAQRLSTFYGYYVLEARAQASDYQGAIENIRDFWGGMLEMGATTFWEDFDLEWTENAAPIDAVVPEGKRDIHGDCGAHCYVGLRHSLCHGWAGGPTAWLSEHVLGIKVKEPGCAVIQIDPHLGDLEWAEGTFPTPHGVVHVKHTKLDDGTNKSHINAPEGVEITR